MLGASLAKTIWDPKIFLPFCRSFFFADVNKLLAGLGFFYHLLLISFYVHFFLFCFFVFLLSRRARFYKAPFFRWQHHQFVPVFRYPICVDAFLRFCCKFWSHGIAYCRLLSPSIHWLHSISYSGGWRILYINLINLTKSPTKSLMVYEATPQSSKSNPLRELKGDR